MPPAFPALSGLAVRRDGRGLERLVRAGLRRGTPGSRLTPTSPGELRTGPVRGAPRCAPQGVRLPGRRRAAVLPGQRVVRPRADTRTATSEGSTWRSTNPGCHDDGEIWVQTLWDLRQALVAEHGNNEGVTRARAYITDGMRPRTRQPHLPRSPQRHPPGRRGPRPEGPRPDLGGLRRAQDGPGRQDNGRRRSLPGRGLHPPAPRGRSRQDRRGHLALLDEPQALPPRPHAHAAHRGDQAGVVI